jgi:hypothetical protein
MFVIKLYHEQKKPDIVSIFVRVTCGLLYIIKLANYPQKLKNKLNAKK